MRAVLAMAATFAGPQGQARLASKRPPGRRASSEDSPLSQLEVIGADESTQEAIGDWHYWVGQGCILVKPNSHMPRRQEGSQPTWTDVKAQLSSFDRLGLLGLIQDLYVAHKDNQTFLHARFGLGQDVLKPYKETLDRWLWPDVLRNQDTSVIKAKQAISSFKKAVGDLAGLAELMVFYCECAAGFCNDVGYQDEAYLNALVRMFEQALKAIAQLAPKGRNPLITA